MKNAKEDLFSEKNQLGVPPDLGECPDCAEGKMRERTNSQTGDKFYGCSNYPECRYTKPGNFEELEECPACDIGFLITRVNRRTDSEFQGCSRYPECDYTERDEETGETEMSWQ